MARAPSPPSTSSTPSRRRGYGPAEPALPPRTPELSAEVATQLSEILNDLVFAFDGQYFVQIRRYYDERRECERVRHDGRLEPFFPRRRSESPAACAPQRRARCRIHLTTNAVIIAITVAPPCPEPRSPGSPTRTEQRDKSSVNRPKQPEESPTRQRGVQHRVGNRTQKVIDRCGVPAGGVLADLFGVNARRILNALVEGRSREAILDSLDANVSAKLGALGEALALDLDPTRAGGSPRCSANSIRSPSVRNGSTARLSPPWRLGISDFACCNPFPGSTAPRRARSSPSSGRS